VPGSIAFEWLEGGHFLIQRSRNDHELFPDAISIIGAPEAGTGWPWSTSIRAACAGRTASHSTTSCCASGATTTEFRPHYMRRRRPTPAPAASCVKRRLERRAGADGAYRRQSRMCSFSRKAAPLPHKRLTVVWQARALSTGKAQLVIDEAKRFVGD
jgi:hypothetical protein